MAERSKRRRRPSPPPQPAARVPARAVDESERNLGRMVALGLPAAAFIGAVGVGAIAGFGSAILVLAAGALLGAIALLWASVRTLSGDAPLPLSFEGVDLGRHGVDDLAERKLRVLRALKDLESEHALGKIDDADYRAVAAGYREEAKAVMKQMDVEIAPKLEEAERIAREYLARTSGAPAPEADVPPARTDQADEGERARCPKCSTSNEADAAFCKKCGAAIGAAAEEKEADATG